MDDSAEQLQATITAKTKGKSAAYLNTCWIPRIRPRKPGDDENHFQPKYMEPVATRQKKKTRLAAKTGAATPSKQGAAPPSNKGRPRMMQDGTTVGKKRPSHVGRFLGDCDERPWEPIPHSTKTLGLMNLVRRLLKEAPDDKIISSYLWSGPSAWYTAAVSC